ncbi:MAG TPA: D-alanyl-D-alanine carboxypeptidase [Stellaceae bacterium]|nr:D-alanyl-D-alanine carboxypeptidase [Stellaceae bacterium]
MNILIPLLAAVVLLCAGAPQAGADCVSLRTSCVPADIEAIMQQSRYDNATWGLRVVDLNSSRVLLDLNSDYDFFIGSVRKIFSIGELLEQVGAAHRYDTPIYRRGKIDRKGVLHGDLILVASGDLTMGGRTRPDGTIAVSDYDHNEADSLGNAVLTRPNPLAGYSALARQVAAAGITAITGDVAIDDRLFQPFSFRNEFYVRPIFVNDDVVDLIIDPTSPGNPARVRWRPVSQALQVESTLVTSGAGSNYALQLASELPQCIGQPGCAAQVTGQLPVNFSPPFTGKFPLVQTFRIVEPANYARTVLIEALQKAGVTVNAAATEPNPVQLLPPRRSYSPAAKVAELEGLPYADDAKLILKVSYNIGADTSLVLFGVANGVDNMEEALAVERENLTAHYGIPAAAFHFVDGSGGGATTATNKAVTRMLEDMSVRATFPAFFEALPILGVDGSIAPVTDFESDPTLAGAKGQVHAKVGTYLLSSGSGLIVKGQAFGGYVAARSGRRLAFELVVNNVAISSLNDLLQIFQDEGTISAMLWRDN